MVHRESTEIETVRVIHVPPNPHIFKGSGLGQSFEAAVADLIDNSLDVGASRVALGTKLAVDQIRPLRRSWSGPAPAPPVHTLQPDQCHAPPHPLMADPHAVAVA